MRAVVQRVSWAEVEVEETLVGKIGPGLLVYLGAEKGDAQSDLDYCVSKIKGIRIFEGDDGKMTKAVKESGNAVLVVSQFTLFGEVKKGLRPSFDLAEEPSRAKELYDLFCDRLRNERLEVQTGQFRAHMKVRCEVNGPVTIFIDSRK